MVFDFAWASAAERPGESNELISPSLSSGWALVGVCCLAFVR